MRLIILGVLEVVLHTSVAMHLDWANFGRLTVLYLAAAVPFFITGLLFSIVFARHPARITQLYGADLLGGSLACLALVPLLNFIGGPNTILFAAVPVALAGVAWANSRARWTPAILALLLLALIAVNFRGKLIDIVYAKGMKRAPPLFAKWNALSRVEVDEQGWAKVIVIDADASTYLMNTDPHHWNARYQRDLMSAAPALANVLRPQGDYAIIGPGGGVDVQRAVANGSPNVTGIEINPIIVNDIMRDRFADYTYHLYEIPEVHIHVSDGRSFIRNSRDQYDVVQMTLVDTWASTAAGAFALSENNLYTVEAFREYFEHLKPDGMIAITRWEFAQPREALRVVSQAMEALRQLGVQDSTQNFIVVSDGPLDADGRPVLVLAKKSPFTEEEQLAVLSHIKGATPDERASQPACALYSGDRGPAGHGASGICRADSQPGCARVFGGLCLQRHSGDRQRSVLLLHPEAGAGLPRLEPGRHRLESEPGHRHPGTAAHHLDCGGDRVSGGAVGAVAGRRDRGAVCACCTSSPSAWDTFWSRSRSFSASCCSWEIRPTR